VRALVGVSGVYNVAGLADHFHERGLYRPLLERIMSFEGQPELKLFSPAHCVKARGAGASVVAHERACVRWLCVRCAARVMRLCHPAGGHCSNIGGAQAGRGA